MYSFGKFLYVLGIVYAFIIYPVINRLLGEYGSITDLFICVIFSITSIVLFFRLKIITLNKIDVLFILFNIWLLVRIFTSSVPTEISSVFIVLLSVLIYLCVRISPFDCYISHILFVGGCVQAFIGILQSNDLFQQYNLFFKVSGSFNNPALWGLYLAISFLSGYALLLKHKNCLLHISPFIILILYALYLSQSRTAWLAVICGIIYLHKLYKKKIFITISLLFLLYLLYIQRPESVIGRLYIYVVSLDIFNSSPLFGHGVGSFKSLYMPAQAEWLMKNQNSNFAFIADDNIFTFNELLHIGCETGIIGIGLFISVILYCMILRNKSHNEKFYISILILLTTFSMFSYPFNELLFIIIFSVIVALISNNYYKPIVVINVRKHSYVYIVLFCLLALCVAAKYTRRYYIIERTLHYSAPGIKNNAIYIGIKGERLYNMGKYIDAIPLLEKSNKLIPNSKILNILGVCYRIKGNYDIAEKTFIQSSEMVPSRILPRYNLFKLYLQQKNYDKAKKSAFDILNMKVKVVNSTVIRIRNEIKEFSKNI